MADNAIPGGTFEDATDFWSLAGSALLQEDGNAYEGTGWLSITARSQSGNPWTTGSALSDAYRLITGHTYALSVYRMQTDTSYTTIRGKIYLYESDTEDGSFALAGTRTITATNAYSQYTSTYVPAKKWGKVLISVDVSSEPTGGLLETTVWRFDNIVLDPPEVTPVAYLGPELAVSAMIAVLQDNIAAELAKIDKERNDSVSAPATTFDCVYNRPLETFVGNVLQLEVFPDQCSFPDIERDLSTWLASSPQITTEVPLVVRLRFANRGSSALAPVDMARITERYAAAIVRLIRNDPQLANGGSANVAWAKPLAMRVSQSISALDETENQYVDTVELDVSVTLRESAANEDTVGGGQAVSFSGGLGLT